VGSEASAKGNFRGVRMLQRMRHAARKLGNAINLENGRIWCGRLGLGKLTWSHYLHHGPVTLQLKTVLSVQTFIFLGQGESGRNLVKPTRAT